VRARSFPALAVVVTAIGGATMTAGCAPHPLRLPAGPGTPFPDAATAFEQATAPCRDVRTLTAELSLSGRAGAQRIRGRVLAGLAEPAAIRLEGVAPFGPPAFILVARGGSGTLLLPRDNRVLAGAEPAQILDALVGLALGPDELRAVLAGCFTTAAAAGEGRAYGEWARVDEANGGAVYLRRQADGWRIVAGTKGPLTVEYTEFVNARPRHLVLRTGSGSDVKSTIHVELSQVELNVSIPDEAFDVKIPAAAEALTLDQLRSAGPLGDHGRSSQ
jgi:hypothetical protein